MHAAVRGVIKVAEETPDHVTILDTEASTEHLLVSTAKHADAMFAVVEPYFTSLETGRRINMLARDLGIERVAMIANKVKGPEDVEIVDAFAQEEGLEIVGTIPWDNCFHEAERAERAPIDFAPDAEAMRAVGRLAPRLLEYTTAEPGPV
jgi:CO dehydrogenase maturation factor